MLNVDLLVPLCFSYMLIVNYFKLLKEEKNFKTLFLVYFLVLLGNKSNF